MSDWINHYQRRFLGRAAIGQVLVPPRTVYALRKTRQDIIGRIEHGFVGYHFSPEGLGTAAKTRDDFQRGAVRGDYLRR